MGLFSGFLDGRWVTGYSIRFEDPADTTTSEVKVRRTMYTDRRLRSSWLVAIGCAVMVALTAAPADAKRRKRSARKAAKAAKTDKKAAKTDKKAARAAKKAAKAAARAAKKAAKKKKKEAKKLAKQAKKAFKKKDFKAALKLFARSFQLDPKPKMVLKIAECQQALKNYRRAIGALRHYMSKLSPRKRRKFEPQLKALQAKLVHIVLKVKPAGATVSVNGRVLKPGAWAKPVTRDPGTYQVVVTKAGHKPFARTLDMPAGKRVILDVQLVKVIRKGTVTVEPTPSTAMVSIDGGAPRPGPVTVQLDEGTHLVRVTAPGHKAQKKSVTVKAGATARLDVKLEPEGVPRPARVVSPIPRPGPKPGKGKRVAGAPFYKKWWFWTVIGVAVAGAAGAAGYFVWDGSQSDESYNRSIQFR